MALGQAGFEERTLAARTRRIQKHEARVKWFGDKLQAGLKVKLATRVRVAGQLLRDRVVINVSMPVRKIRSRISRRTVVDPTSRSKRGEFPRADTTRLMKDIFFEIEVSRGSATASVGTTLDYGRILELHMDRSFLRRTMREMEPLLRQILTTGLF